MLKSTNQSLGEMINHRFVYKYLALSTPQRYLLSLGTESQKFGHTFSFSCFCFLFSWLRSNSKHIFYSSFFRVATLCFDQGFAHSWHDKFSRWASSREFIRNRENPNSVLLHAPGWQPGRARHGRWNQRSQIWTRQTKAPISTGLMSILSAQTNPFSLLFFLRHGSLAAVWPWRPASHSLLCTAEECGIYLGSNLRWGFLNLSWAAEVTLGPSILGRSLCVHVWS